MKIEIMGTGCPRCKELYENTRQVLKNKGIEAEVVKVEDLEKISAAGVLITPALVIDGKIKSSGKILSVKEIEKIIV
ncbi:MAG: thioredoxin family protein [Candidatus Omnitrophota bacterium]